MKFGSVCSGIEAASVAWHPLGWRAQWLAEIDNFPSKVLAHHYPETPNYGDFTNITTDAGEIELLVGGTPCQSFSLAGLRGGLSDDRGNLALEFIRLADRFRPRWIVWENVPGVLSSNGGRDFGSILGALVNVGYGFAYRVLDAQFFGVPQRRRRVFLVGHLGDWRLAAAVLFERESLRGNPAKIRKARKEAATYSIQSTAICRAPTSGPGGAGISEGVSYTLDCREPHAVVSVNGSLSHTLRAEGFDASEDGTGRGTPIVAFDTTQITSKTNRSNPLPGDPCHPLAAGAHPPAIAFHPTQDPIFGAVSPCLSKSVDGMGVAHCLTAHAAKGGDPSTDNYTVQDYRVRRLTPRECERLQGFPDDYTAIPGASDSARYRALGNSMAVPCMRWIGRRIADVEKL